MSMRDGDGDEDQDKDGDEGRDEGGDGDRLAHSQEGEMLSRGSCRAGLGFANCGGQGN